MALATLWPCGPADIHVDVGWRNCVTHGIEWSAATTGACAICGSQGQAGRGPPHTGGARRRLPRPGLTPPAALPSVGATSTATPTDLPLPPDGQLVFEGGHYLGPVALGAIREHGRGVVNTAWLEEDAEYGPRSRAGDAYWNHLATCASVGCNAAMALFDAAHTVDAERAAAASLEVESDP